MAPRGRRQRRPRRPRRSKLAFSGCLISKVCHFNLSSFFQDLRVREVNGFRVRGAKPLSARFLSPDSGSFNAGEITTQHDGATSPSLAIAFGKTGANGHLLAVSDKDGFVSLYDTRLELSTTASGRQNAAKAKVCDWAAHHHVVFDIRWNKGDAQILTASGDQTIRIWNVETNKCLGSLIGHTGSVKSVCPHASNPDLVVSGSRDGSFAIWDLRCKSGSRDSNEEQFIMSTAVVNGAHVSPRLKQARRKKAAHRSVTSVLYLKDEVSVVTAGAADTIIKYWDTRELKGFALGDSILDSDFSEGRIRSGISSLSQDSAGVRIAASCMDNGIELHHLLQFDELRVKAFMGAWIKSFYVKSAISPDGAYILSGSGDGHAYIWQADKPDEWPIGLSGHEGEVTAVDWCPSEVGKVATSDDFVVRIWNWQTVGRCTVLNPYL